MIHRSLNNTLKPDCLLEHIFIASGNPIDFFLKKIFNCFNQVFDITAAVFYNVNAGRIVQDRKKNVLDADIFVTSLFCFSDSKAKSRTEFFADHNLFSFHNAF